MKESKGALRRLFCRNEAEKSIFFITLHKAASSFFSSYVLKEVEGFKHVDYETELFLGKKDVDIIFEKKGCVYGAIRLLANPNAESFKIIEKITEKGFINNKKCIFMTRDPRDIMVSSFYSFGYSHILSPDKKIREKQLKNREKIQKKGIDRFVLGVAPSVDKRFEMMFELMKRCKNYIYLKYEDMLENYDIFYDKLTGFLPLKEEVKEKLYTLTRPQEEEDITKHKRSGKIGGYKEKLKPETIREINNQLKDVLLRFDYAS